MDCDGRRLASVTYFGSESSRSMRKYLDTTTWSTQKGPEIGAFDCKFHCSSRGGQDSDQRGHRVDTKLSHSVYF